MRHLAGRQTTYGCYIALGLLSQSQSLPQSQSLSVFSAAANVDCDNKMAQLLENYNSVSGFVLCHADTHIRTILLSFCYVCFYCLLANKRWNSPLVGVCAAYSAYTWYVIILASSVCLILFIEKPRRVEYLSTTTSSVVSLNYIAD